MREPSSAPSFQDRSITLRIWSSGVLSRLCWVAEQGTTRRAPPRWLERVFCSFTLCSEVIKVDYGIRFCPDTDLASFAEGVVFHVKQLLIVEGHRK